jgi:hypothetical protein
MRVFFFLIVAAVVASFGSGRAASGPARFLLDRGEVAFDLGEGQVLRRDALIGLILVVSNGSHDVQVRIDGVETDSSRPGETLTLYRTSLLAPGAAVSAPACQVDPQGRRTAFLYPDESGRFRLTCTSGAQGKCILFGYRPWEQRGRPMRDLHRACVHMLRADYGGDDRPTTRDGTEINIYDRFGIQEASVAPAMTFEAAWGPDGAICVAHPRIAEHVSLEQLAQRYPALKGHLGPEGCTEDAMRIHPGALILNASVPTRP